MSGFTGLSGWYRPSRGVKYLTTKPVEWENGAKGSGHWVRVPEGYEFDVSIPRALWWLLSPRDARFHKAACLHDYCLHVLEFGRVSSAASFSDALKATGVGKWTRLAMVLSVIVWRWK
ncbi:DUF1353 domain-containing protein [uncultured Planktomarina sp.]|uniref:DUF1353 domain-containing protein n=1 Tax=uncultured Planktomarina sp. TaxID=1538529 RepID=UPI003261CDC7